MYDYCIHSDSSQATDLLIHFSHLLQPDRDSMQDWYLTLFYQFFQDFFPSPHHTAYDKF